MLMMVCPFLSSLRVLFLFLAFPRWLGEPVPSHTVGWGAGGRDRGPLRALWEGPRPRRAVAVGCSRSLVPGQGGFSSVPSQ